MANGSASRLLLDAVTAPLHPLARDTLVAALDAGWGDPRRLHAEGRAAAQLLETGRAVLAEGLDVAAGTLSLHSSPAQALDTAIRGLRHGRRRVGERLVTTAVDQAIVLAHAGAGHDEYHPVAVDTTGRVDLTELAAAVRAPGVGLVVLASANPEVGTCQPIDEVHRLCRAVGVPLLVDATAGLGRQDTPAHWDVLVGSSASFAGPPLGILVVRPGTRFDASGPGRESEYGRALAPAWVPLVLAAAEAWQQTRAAHADDEARSSALIEQIRRAARTVTDTEVVGDAVARLPHVVTFSALYCDGETLVRAFDQRGYAVASGSACTSSTLAPSHVLAAMGALTHGNVRVTLPLPSLVEGLSEGVTAFCATIPEVVAQVRAQLGVGGL